MWYFLKSQHLEEKNTKTIHQLIYLRNGVLFFILEIFTHACTVHDFIIL